MVVAAATPDVVAYTYVAAYVERVIAFTHRDEVGDLQKGGL